MKKHTWTLSMIIVLCLALFPSTLLAAVSAVTPISSEVHPGSQLTISGTSNQSKVIIKVLRPDDSILYFNIAPVSSSSYNDSITLGQNEPIGTYQILVGQGGDISTTSFEVTAMLTVSTPTASPVAGEVASGTSVTLSSLTEGAAIYYTVDGSTPTTSSTLYSSPITVNSAKTIKAIAVKDGLMNSGVLSSSYTITSSSSTDNTQTQPQPPQQPTPTATPAVVTNINGAAGGEILSKEAKIKFPSNAFTGQFKVTMEPVTDTSQFVTNTNSKIVGKVLSIKKDVAGSFNAPITITFNVDVKEIDSKNYNYAVYWYNEQTKQWVILDNIAFNPATGDISGEVTHFTMFTVLATEKVVVAEQPVPTNKVLMDIKGHWAEQNIQKLVDLGAIAGYPDSSFLPNKTITRAEFVQVLVKAFSLKQQGDQVFEDTKGHWAQESISTALANKIVTGYDTKRFGPNDPITREQIASMIMRAAELTPVTTDSSFTDHAKISAWAQGSVAALVQKGIVKGYADGSFKPQDAATRAEAVTMILLSIQ